MSIEVSAQSKQQTQPEPDLFSPGESKLETNPQVKSEAQQELSKVQEYVEKLEQSINGLHNGKRGNPEEFRRILTELNRPENLELRKEVVQRHDIVEDIVNNRTQTDGGSHPSAFSTIDVYRTLAYLADSNEEKAKHISDILKLDLNAPLDDSISKENLSEIVREILNAENYEEIEKLYNISNPDTTFVADIKNFSLELAETLENDFQKERFEAVKKEEKSRAVAEEYYNEELKKDELRTNELSWVKSAEVMQWLVNHPLDVSKFKIQTLGSDGKLLHVGENSKSEYNARLAQNKRFRELLDSKEIILNEKPEENEKMRASRVPSYASEYQRMNSPYTSDEDYQEYRTKREDYRSHAGERMIDAVKKQVVREREYLAVRKKIDSIREEFNTEQAQKRYNELYVEPAKRLYEDGKENYVARERFSDLSKELRDQVLDEHFEKNPPPKKSKYLIDPEVAKGLSNEQLESLTGPYAEKERQAVKAAFVESGNLEGYTRFKDIVEKTPEQVAIEKKEGRDKELANKHQQLVKKIAYELLRDARKFKDPGAFKMYIEKIKKEGKVTPEIIEMFEKKKFENI